ncbi:MAG: glycosyltransferase family 39 protein [Lentisphaerae bacterium]|nr:glycosyltransferase family 39 protein [Lentisphaerota bacterium]
MTRFQKYTLALLIAVAALLRFGGLSHDLHEGHIYHPDTPKQMRAVERFLKGQYYQHTGIADYDGYPYLTSHLVEMLCRVGMPVHNAALNLVGIPTTPGAPDINSIYWIALLLNATLAVLLVPIVYRLGAEHLSPGAGLLAAAFMAVSPADVTACHYTNGDTAAAFFATLSLLHALRIRTTGRLRHYAWAAIFAVAGFAAKYHAGVAVFPIAIAHLYRFPSPRAFFTWAAWRRIVLTAVLAAITLFLTIPTLIQHTQPVLSDILGFFSHVSRSSRLPGEIKHVGALGRFLFAMERNGPILLQIFGLVICLAAPLCLLLRGRRQPPVVIIASVPLVYFFIGVSFRPLAPAVYHTIMTPMMFLLGAALLTATLGRAAAPQRLWRSAAALLAALTLLTLARESRKEVFFQWHQDTRRLAQSWTGENVPPGVYVNKDRYTFAFETSPEEWPTNGMLFLRSSIAPGQPPTNYLSAARFRLETTSLMQFRNPDIDIWLGDSPLIAPNCRMPIPQRWPSQADNQFVFENAFAFLRDGKSLDLDAGQTPVRRLVCESPLAQAWIIVRNGPLPNYVTVSAAGAPHVLHLAPGAATAVHVPAPRDSFPRQPGVFLYRWSATASTGPARITLATTPADAGLALYNAGLHADAAPLLASAAPASQNPTLAILALAARAAASQPPPAPDNPLRALADRFPDSDDDAAVFAAFNLTAYYVDRLWFATFTGDDLAVSGYKLRHRSQWDATVGPESDAIVLKPPMPPARRACSVATPVLFLDPGHYRLCVRLGSLAFTTNSAPMLRVDVEAPGGTALSSRAVAMPMEGLERIGMVTVPVVVPVGVPFVKIVLYPDPVMALTLPQLTIAPDVAANLRALRLLRDVVKGDAIGAAAAEPLATDVLLAAGRDAEQRGDALRAAACYQAALQGQPDARRPLEALHAMRDQIPPGRREDFALARAAAWADARARQRRVELNTDFRNGLRLVAAEFLDTQLQAGGVLAFNLHWDVAGANNRFAREVVWVHVLDAAGNIAFQADHELARDLQAAPGADALRPGFESYAIPPNVPPGLYQVHVGLMQASGDRRRVKIAASPAEVRSRGVILPQPLEIVAAPPGTAKARDDDAADSAAASEREEAGDLLVDQPGQ